MADVLKKAFELLVGSDDMALPSFKLPRKKRPLKKMTERELIQLESEVGAKLFGPIPRGHRREFFNLDPKTWIWHEEWMDHSGKRRTSTTRYEVHDNGILKAQEGARYSFLEGQELENFVVATRLYYEEIAREIYKVDPQTGRPLIAQTV
jgi:hypothetical protein